MQNCHLPHCDMAYRRRKQQGHRRPSGPTKRVHGDGRLVQAAAKRRLGRAMAPVARGAGQPCIGSGNGWAARAGVPAAAVAAAARALCALRRAAAAALAVAPARMRARRCATAVARQHERAVRQRVQVCVGGSQVARGHGHDPRCATGTNSFIPCLDSSAPSSRDLRFASCTSRRCCLTRSVSCP